MRVAQVAPLFESVPPKLYGGTERVVSWLTEELMRRGHEVTLFASGDSRTAAKLVPVTERALRLKASQLVDHSAWHQVLMGMLQEQRDEFDVIHSHLDHVQFASLREAANHVVTTLHGRLDIDGLQRVYEFFSNFPLVSISDAQREPLPNANWIATIHHGLPLQEYKPGPGSGDYFVFLGRIAPEKRPDTAIKVARKAGVRLVIAAKVDPVDEAYYEQVVEPLLLGSSVEFIGEVDEETKAELLRDACGLLFPILWPEPFGLAMIEAMAFGTPVITRRCGSTPEVVAHGHVGYVCDDDDELVEAVKKVEALDRADCRRWVEEHFSVERMASEYERIYAAVLEP